VITATQNGDKRIPGLDAKEQGCKYPANSIVFGYQLSKKAERSIEILYSIIIHKEAEKSCLALLPKTSKYT